MKKHILILLMILPFFSFSQRLKSVGVDAGHIIFPLILGFKGYAGGVIVQVLDSTNKNTEYIIGYSSFERFDNKIKGTSLVGDFTQKSRGFYAGMGRVYKNNYGWHGLVSIYQVQNTLFLLDNDFNQSYQYEFGEEQLISIGGDFFYELPIKFSRKIQTNIRLCISASIGTTTKNAERVLYSPGFNIQSPRIILPTFGFGLSIPVFLNLK